MAKRFAAMCLLIISFCLLLTIPVLAEDTPDWMGDWANNGQAVEDSNTDAVEPAAPVFPDVLDTDWFYPHVMTLHRAGVIAGFNDGTFRPNAVVTTGQALKMVLLAAGYSEPAPVASHWARCYLDLALNEGILERGPTYDLDVSITRGMVAQIAARALGLQRESDSQFFTDTNDDNAHALFEAEIITGYSDNSFQPQKNLKRSELSAIVDRIYVYALPDEPSPSGDPSAVTLRTSEKGVALIKKLEGFSPMAYPDYPQLSIGYGSRCKEGEYPNGITEAEADLLLRTMLADMEKELDAFLDKNGLTLSQQEYDALTSFTYNTGSGWTKNSRLSKLMIAKNRDVNEFASAFGIWCHAGKDAQIHDGLINRRLMELQLFFDGDYSAKVGSAFRYLIFKTDRGTLDVDIAFYRTGTTLEPFFGASCPGDSFLGWEGESGQLYQEGSPVPESQTVTAKWQNGDLVTEDPSADPIFVEPDWDGESGQVWGW